MTLPRTIHRRNARKRARAVIKAEARRFAALSPEQQRQEIERQKYYSEICESIALDGLRKLEHTLRMTKLFNREYKS